MGWPDNTLQRFRLFNSVSEEVLKFDYAFFFNANIEFVKTINEDVLPNQGIIVVKHQGLYNKDRKQFNYGTNKLSKAYIDPIKGEIYICGGVNGGRAKDYLKMCKELYKRTEQDSKNGIVAKVHDESHLNRYIVELEKSEYTVWDSGYAYIRTFTICRALQ